MRKATMPERRKPRPFKQENRNSQPKQNETPTQRVRHVIERESDNTEKTEEETIYAEAALYIEDLMEDWASRITGRPSPFKEIRNVSTNKELAGEYWLKTSQKTTSNLTGWWTQDPPRSSMEEPKAREIKSNSTTYKKSNSKKEIYMFRQPRHTYYRRTTHHP